MDDSIHDNVKKYYGETLQTSSDLKTNACCTISTYPEHIKKVLSKIHPDVLSKYYGCGLVTPEVLKGLKVIDLGCGAGRDVYLLSSLVGESGEVIGIDMTEQQLKVAREHKEFHQKAFNFQKSNVEFKKAKLEEMGELDLTTDHYDLIISNCVINLCKDKQKVLETSYSLLKEGGEIYFSDVYCNRRIPEELVNDPVLYGECLSGALYWNDFENLAKSVGFADPRMVEVEAITLESPAIQKKLEGYEFYSITYRLFKISELEPHCEDFGQAVRYKGTIPESSNALLFDGHHTYPAGKIIPVCGNSYNMLKLTRYCEHFEFFGDFDTHYGIFENCGITPPYSSTTFNTQENQSSCC